MRNEEVRHRVREEGNSLLITKWKKANWIGHILCRNCLLKHIIEGKVEGRIEAVGRRGRRRKQLLSDLEEKGRQRKLKRKHWITPFGDLALEEVMNHHKSINPYYHSCVFMTDIYSLLMDLWSERLRNEWMNEWKDEVPKIMGGSNLQLVQYMIPTGLNLTSSKLIYILHKCWRYITPTLHMLYSMHSHFKSYRSRDAPPV